MATGAGTVTLPPDAVDVAPSGQASGLPPDAVDVPTGSSELYEGQAPQTVGHAASEAWNGLNPVTALMSVAHAVRHPEDAVKAVAGASEDQISKAQEAYQRHSYIEAAGHLLGSFPILGPAAAKVGETLSGTDPEFDNRGNVVKKGTPPDPAGAIGAGGALIGSMLAPGLLKNAKAPAVASNVAERLYQSALKPGAAVGDTADVARVVGTGLREGIPVSEGGIQKLYGLIDDLNQKIKARVQHAAASGTTIDPQAVARRVDQIAPKFGLQVNPDADMSALQASKDEFLNGGGAKPGVPAQPPQPTGVLDAQGRPVMNGGTAAVPPTPRPPIPADTAQAMKQNTYAQLRGNYGQLSSAQVEAQKALARGIKEELNNAIPGLAADNAKEGSMVDLSDALERRVRVVMNHNIIGIGTPIVAEAAAKMKGGVAGVVAGVMKSVLDDPTMKSKLALSLYRSSRGTGVPLTLTRATARVNQFIDSLGNSPALQTATAPAQ